MSSEKKLPASGKRREKLRAEGSVVKSPEISTASMLTTGLLVLLFTSSSIADAVARIMRNCFIDIGRTSSQGEFFLPFNTGDLGGLILPLAEIMAAICAAVIIPQLLQVGLFFSDQILEPKWDKLNPITGFGRFFTIRRFVTTGQALFKVVLIVFFTYFGARSLLQSSVFTRPINAVELGSFFKLAAWEIGWRVIMMLTIFATVDYLYQKWQWEKDHRMTEEEVKEEHKSSEGSPEVKKKQRSMRRRSLRRMFEDMQDATIVITNPTHYAIALRYRRGDTPVPLVIAKGARLIAQRIKADAASRGISIVENKPIAQGLYKHGRIGHPIPVIYYQAVATVLAELYRRGLRDAGSSSS